MSDVTKILKAIEAGEPHAVAVLLPLVYDELRRLAASQMKREKTGQTLDATGLVHEAYLRLLGANNKNTEEFPEFANRAWLRWGRQHPRRLCRAVCGHFGGGVKRCCCRQALCIWRMMHHQGLAALKFNEPFLLWPDYPA